MDSSGESADLEGSGILSIGGAVPLVRSAVDGVGAALSQLNLLIIILAILAVLLIVLISTYLIWRLR